MSHMTTQGLRDFGLAQFTIAILIDQIKLARGVWIAPGKFLPIEKTIAIKIGSVEAPLGTFTQLLPAHFDLIAIRVLLGKAFQITVHTHAFAGRKSRRVRVLGRRFRAAGGCPTQQRQAG